jgi:hypothetical protein
MAEEEVRNSADMAGADFKVKMEKVRADNSKIAAKEAANKPLSAAEEKRKKALANIAVTAHRQTALQLENDLEKVYGCSGANGIIANGLTDAQVEKGHVEFGLNQLTPPPQTPPSIVFSLVSFVPY